MKALPMLCLAALTIPGLEPLHAAQEPNPAVLRIDLSPRSPTELVRVPWSPKGEKISLSRAANALVGSIAIGPDVADSSQPNGTPNRKGIALTKTEDAEHWNHLWLDRDRNGRHSADEEFDLEISESRGKFWSTTDVTLQLPLAEGRESRAYPLSFWFVEDPTEPEQEPVLRWSRRGWHQGAGEWKGEPMHVLITDMEMDGLFSGQDAWHLSRDSANVAHEASSRPLSRHAWLGEQAFRMTRLDPNGMWIELEPFDPGVTRAEEAEADDVLREDKRAERAQTPLAFGHDYEAAVALAKSQGKILLVDFETTWCGPCKTMDNLVYTAKQVVDAASERGVIAVKVDGDERKDLKKLFKVEAFPTMILLDFTTETGSEADRQVGYLGVKAMARFLLGTETK